MPPRAAACHSPRHRRKTTGATCAPRAINAVRARRSALLTRGGGASNAYHQPPACAYWFAAPAWRRLRRARRFGRRRQQRRGDKTAAAPAYATGANVAPALLCSRDATAPRLRGAGRNVNAAWLSRYVLRFGICAWRDAKTNSLARAARVRAYAALPPRGAQRATRAGCFAYARRCLRACRRARAHIGGAHSARAGVRVWQRQRTGAWRRGAGGGACARDGGARNSGAAAFRRRAARPRFSPRAQHKRLPRAANAAHNSTGGTCSPACNISAARVACAALTLPRRACRRALPCHGAHYKRFGGFA